MGYDFAALAVKAKAQRKRNVKLLLAANNSAGIQELPKLHAAAFSHIHCLDCSNCCKNHSPRFKAPDIKRISKHLGVKESNFITTYLKIDSDGDYVMQQQPCSFLAEDNTCNIYDFRPRDCARYPYTDEDVLVKQPKLTQANASVCPAVDYVLDKMAGIAQPQGSKV